MRKIASIVVAVMLPTCVWAATTELSGSPVLDVTGSKETFTDQRLSFAYDSNYDGMVWPNNLSFKCTANVATMDVVVSHRFSFPLGKRDYDIKSELRGKVGTNLPDTGMPLFKTDDTGFSFNAAFPRAEFVELAKQWAEGEGLTVILSQGSPFERIELAGGKDAAHLKDLIASCEG